MSLVRVPHPRSPPGPGLKMRLTRDPSFRVRQGVRDNNVPLLSRLQQKADLRNTDRNRLTSLSWAAIEGSLEVFEWLLLDYGHDDQELSRDSDSNTILHLLASVPSPPPHLVHSTPSFPPRPSPRSLADKIATSLRMTQLYHSLFPFLLDWSNSGGKTALHVAAQAGNHEFISLLCDLGADVDLTDLQGNTPLHYASAWGHLETIRVLLEQGCGSAARNFEGFTASDFAYSNSVLSTLQGLAKSVLQERQSRRRTERDVAEEQREDERLSASMESWKGRESPARPQYPFPEMGSAASSFGDIPTSFQSLTRQASELSRGVETKQVTEQYVRRGSDHTGYDFKPVVRQQSDHSSRETPDIRRDAPPLPDAAVRPQQAQRLPENQPAHNLQPSRPIQETYTSRQAGQSTQAEPQPYYSPSEPSSAFQLAAPLPGLIGSVGMRRGTSAVSSSSATSAGPRKQRAASGASGRGTPI